MSNPLAAGSGIAFSTFGNGGGSVSNLPLGYVHGCEPLYISASQVQISSGVLRSDDDTEDIIVSATLTADVSTTGANGRNVDTAEAASKWYAIFVIKNVSTSAVASFLINEDDLGAFTFPAGYTVKRRVGWIRNDGSSNFRKALYVGKGVRRMATYDVERSNLLALNSGSATSYTVVDFSEWIPPQLTYGYLNTYINAIDPDHGEIRPYNSTITNSPFMCQADDDINLFKMPVGINAGDGTRRVEYKVSVILNDLDIYVIGWEDEI